MKLIEKMANEHSKTFEIVYDRHTTASVAYHAFEAGFRAAKEMAQKYHDEWGADACFTSPEFMKLGESEVEEKSCGAV